MLFYVIRRLLYMVVVLFLLSVVAFIIIQLPPGDYVTFYVAEMESMRGERLQESEIIALRKAYGVDQPMYVQYFKWLWKLSHGDFGMSREWQRPVIDLIMERLPLTVMLSLFTLIFTYIIAIPTGIYSATHQYSIGDYVFTTGGFIGPFLYSVYGCSLEYGEICGYVKASSYPLNSYWHSRHSRAYSRYARLFIR